METENPQTNTGSLLKNTAKFRLVVLLAVIFFIFFTPIALATALLLPYRGTEVSWLGLIFMIPVYVVFFVGLPFYPLGVGRWLMKSISFQQAFTRIGKVFGVLVIINGLIFTWGEVGQQQAKKYEQGQTNLHGQTYQVSKTARTVDECKGAFPKSMYDGDTEWQMCFARTVITLEDYQTCRKIVSETEFFKSSLSKTLGYCAGEYALASRNKSFCNSLQTETQACQKNFDHWGLDGTSGVMYKNYLGCSANDFDCYARILKFGYADTYSGNPKLVTMFCQLFRDTNNLTSKQQAFLNDRCNNRQSLKDLEYN